MPRGKHTRLEYWQQHFNAQTSSGLTTADYLRREGIRSSQWYYWHKKLRSADADGCCENFTLVPVELDTRTLGAQAIRVDLPNGLTITFPPMASPAQWVQSLCHLEI